MRGAHHSFVLCLYSVVTSRWGHDDRRSFLDRIRDVSGNTDAAKVKGSKSRILIYELPEVQPDRRNAAAASVRATRSINAVYCEESFFANIRGAHHSFVLSRYAPVTSQWGHDDPRSSLDRIRDVSGNTDAAKVKGSKARILIYELPEVQP